MADKVYPTTHTGITAELLRKSRRVGVTVAAQLLASLVGNDSSVSGATVADALDTVGGATGVTAGSYTNTDLTVGADGRITAASNGSGGGGGTPSSLDLMKYLTPTAAIAESFPRWACNSSFGTTLLNSGRLALCAIPIGAGEVIGHLAIDFFGSAGTPTNWWFALFDSSFHMLAVTADQLTTATGIGVKSLAIANIASGASSTFTTTYEGLYYLGIMMKASSMPSLSGVTLSTTTVAGASPVLSCVANTGMTSPPPFPFTATTGATVQPHAYGYVAS